MVPDEYKEYANKAEAMVDAAEALKKKKDIMQKKIISKAIEPMWEKFDTEKVGYITKEQCG